MSSLTNINNNSAVVNVGRTLPVSPGQQPAAKSIPVVLATDQTPVPVVEQNKIQSEVALSLLGIPRSEVALGIFADVNTYDVNPAEWSSSPEEHIPGYGIKHLAEEAGALVEAPKNKTAILTSKRFFRYQPGRVSAATFGVKNTKTQINDPTEFNLNPSIKKYGIFDKYDGYYWEVISDGEGDRFSVVRRTQSLLKYISVPFGTSAGQQIEDYSMAGKGPDSLEDEYNEFPLAVKLLIDKRFTIIDAAYTASSAYIGTLSATDQAKCRRDLDFAIDAYAKDLQWGGNGHVIVNSTTYQTADGLNNTEEANVHTALRDAIVTELTAVGESAATTRINTLSAILITAVGGTQLTQPQIDGADYGQRSKIATVFDIYSKYYAYLVSKSITYTNTNPDINVEEIEFRCLRDVRYIMEGYARDLEFGGNAATVFNAKNYYFDGIQVFSQTSGGVVGEIARHQYLKNLLSSATSVAIQVGGTPTGQTIPSLLTRFGLTTLKSRIDALADLVIGNFTSEYYGAAEYGSAAQYGNLIIYRDNLIMIHAAVFDPSLLKASKKIVVRVDVTNNTLECAENTFVIGQHVKFVGNAGGLTNEKIYKVVNVRGPKSNIIKLCEALDDDETIIDITSVGTGTQYIEPYVPFIFPKEYQLGKTPASSENLINPLGAFPYLYTEDGVLPAELGKLTVGFIDTGLDPSTSAGLLKSQIDQVNLKWNNWIKQNVDPKYYSVYEYRIPRSRFSTDQLNGEVNKVVYSDIATGESGRVYAGNAVLDSGVLQENTSVWNLDFTKVTMLKIEFSWYGAVGALFLAYVPVSNGEARWVRVHHLRASNQLKIPSLGNATLPITYLVYGGGDVNQVGITDNSDKGYGNPSEHIVKYGASYYIDGGDRGTVRLYSYSSDSLTDIYGATYQLTGEIINSDVNGLYIDINAATSTGGLTLPNPVFFMNAKVLTSSREDQNVEVIWIEGTKLYLNKSSLVSQTTIKLVSNRPSIVFGLKAKDNILNAQGVGIRNRVQVYPTKLSTANLGNVPVKLKILKTPYFQPRNTTSGSFNLSQDYTITNSVTPLPTASANYLAKDDEYVYGWFRANVGTVFGKLYRDNGQYYFQMLQTFSVEVVLESEFSFLKEQRFSFNGSLITNNSESSITKERLSSVFVSSQIQCPVPKTGIEVAAFFLKPGSDQFDLLSYFDYNKDYLSYPLTNQIESIYLVSDSTSNKNTNPSVEINASLTWEEQ